MWFFTLLSWLAMLVQLVLLTLAVATGLFYLAEIVEEYTSTSAKVIRYLTYATFGIYGGLFIFEPIPISLIICGVLAQCFHLAMLKDFPYFNFSSPTFIGTIVLVCVNHYLAFSYFSEVWHPFSEVLGFFTMCLWLVPFAFFVSLTANDNTLPSTVENSRLIGGNDNDDVLSSYFNKKQKKVGLLSALKYGQELFGFSSRDKKSF